MSLLPILARNLELARSRSGLTLSGLAQRSGIAKSTLSRMEAGQGNPTIDTLWALANALDVPFGSLLTPSDETGPRFEEALTGQGASVRFIERSSASPLIETYILELAPGHLKTSSAHAPGVKEKIVVLQGEMLVGDATRPKRVRAGEAYDYEADVAHVYGAAGHSTRAMVFIEYPELGHSGQELGQVMDWPMTERAWEGAKSLIHRHAIEATQGINGTLLRFRNAPESTTLVQEEISRHACLATGDYRWPLFHACGRDDLGAYLAFIPLHATSAFKAVAPQTEEDTILARAQGLARMAEDFLLPIQDGQRQAIADRTQSPSMTLSCLAAEIALQRGDPRLPHGLSPKGAFEERHAPSEDEEAFSSRVDVDHYAAFELLHPGYARQVVAMAEDIRHSTRLDQAHEAIDIGTGPGSALLMLRELLPELDVTAIEPDDTAFHYLTANFSHDEKVKPHQAGFLDVDIPPASTHLITSVGASHHFNTAFMLQKAMSLLSPGGILCIADEFLPDFHDQDSRQRGLVLHHSAYLLASMAWFGQSESVDYGAGERDIFDDIKHTLCLATLDASHGKTTRAVTACRNLLSRVQKPIQDLSSTGSLGVYLRFFRLELQAMVAGFDYEVERKTHARRFNELALLCGLEPIRHRRVFATVGAEEWQGGTHVFTFRKPSNGPKEKAP
ncbi:helix-turn-helix domain-containing protein [Halomonas sp. McH1-25]|uniref:helix-turn-helix domain-containing protein n=1 Tax=unclassified Halomonas TaxID=2609666 RepID=UPI001EF5C471|nr:MULTISPECIES: helix-turn-helix domain-containing protein [unclassified Halomonas]MCG7600791.1 helix-turn-helix domain-containing protein [Halomonas sp. McH1-25]MCP1342756.1 helix-turn-helix domain-containing protein [Halomonas sp. FL8]MCP1361061.1 helix-turn-helix domain-containing protein [Halomonas sp. BBD45]MCP1365287.1 helix-turn-helix domain-containing protein [Halomonas sp. BBD48]